MKRYLILFSFFLLFFPNICNAKQVVGDKVNAELSKCVDGDTAKFLINGRVVTTRFLAINAPELAHSNNEAEAFSEEASSYTCQLLENAKHIVLETDPKSDRYDKYGRYLAWVWIDETLLQQKLVLKGYAKVDYLYGDYLYTSKLQDAQLRAKTLEAGIWSTSSFESFHFSEQQKILIFAFLAFFFLLFLLNKRFRRVTTHYGEKEVEKYISKQIKHLSN